MTAFLAESPLRTARRYAERDIYGTAPPSEVAWLHDNVGLWMRALFRIRQDVDTHIGKDRQSLAPLKPASGQRVSEEYLAAKAEVAERTRRRLHFQQRLESRLDEVRALFDPRPLPGFWCAGELAGHFLEIAEMADAGDLAAAADKAMFHAKRLARLAKAVTP